MNPLAAYAVAVLALGALARPAGAETVPVFFDFLTESATVASPFFAGDTLYVDTLVTTETGALTQSVTFTLGSGVEGFTGQTAWEVDPTSGVGPRLVGVNIDLFDEAMATLIATDAFAGLFSNFAHSTFDGAIVPGTYVLRTTGTAVRAASMDISLSFTGVPEPARGAAAATVLASLALSKRFRRRSSPW